MAHSFPKPDKTWEYLTNCTDCPGPNAGDDINDMPADAEKISREKFLRYVDTASLKRVEEILGYDKHAAHGLTMARDWHVSYWLGHFRGEACAYFDWSAIEFIFTKSSTRA
jgi:hypothetical protein